jgi:drug/metabolite transporter (DMT)-like permease
VLPLTLAFGASVAWGASDFLGGLATRRMPVAAVLFWAQLAGLALAAAVWLVAGAPLPAARTAALGVAGGLAELAGFAFLYRGLAIGEMSSVAPLAALTAVLPVGVAVGAGERVALLEAAGMVLAVAGSALAAGDPERRRAVRGAGLGLAAAACFGIFLLALGEAAEAGGPAAVVTGRLGSVLVLGVVVAARREGGPPAGRDALSLAALGALDALANLAYARAAAGGGTAVVAVLGSLYPLTTVLLARTLLRETLGPGRTAGIAAVFGGVTLIGLSAG